MDEPTTRRRPKAVTVVVLVLAVIGLISIFGWVLSAIAAIVKLAIIAALVVVGFFVLKAVLIGKPRPDDNLPTQRGL